VLQLRAYASSQTADMVVHRLAEIPGVRHVVSGARTGGGMVEITAEVSTDVADAVLDVARECRLAAEDVILCRTDAIQPLGWRRIGDTAGGNSTVWAEVIGRAATNARLGHRYLLYMVASGVIAGVGVLTGSSILIVGAMALSPDLLPISAAAVGLVDRRWMLLRRAQLVLLVGLATVTLFAAVATLILRLSGRIDEGLDLAETALGPSLTEIGPGTVLVALAAGMAGMLAFETAGAAAVGVAISVTTIPAAAYLGAALGLGRGNSSWGALSVLAVNVICIESASAFTVWVQRRHRRRPIAERPSVADA
jgi:uncharacterized hydrophobic protein (TIGR00271 family)